jgi:hypothetical protein
VVAISATGKTVTVQADNYQRTDKNGQSESQTYIYTPDLNGTKYALRLTKKGWACQGQVFALGFREEYNDPCF